MVGQIASLLLLAAGLQVSQEPSTQKIDSVQEKVAVERVVITGRVIDRFANPIRGLTARDLRLLVDGSQTPIESVEWIPPQSQTHLAPVAEKTVEAYEPGLSSGRSVGAGQTTLTAPHRTIVMLFQWEIAGQKDEGFLRMMIQARHFVMAADPDDRIAVFGYGSSLHLVQDFTIDHAALLEAIEAIRNPGFRGRAAAANGPALSPAVAGCGPTGSIQKAIVCVGKSLQALPGPKTLFFFGWTIGRRRGPWHVEYPEMIEAIGKSQTSVFVFDVSGGPHTLAAGIARLASDTGGLYNGGVRDFYYFPDLARLRVRQALEGGSYEIVFRNPAVGRGWHQVDVELVHRAGTPLFQRWYRD